MATTTVDVSKEPQLNREELFYRLILMWHGVLTLASAGALFVVWISPATTNLPLWQRILLTIIALLFLIGNAIVVLRFNQRLHQARLFSIIINFLGAVATFVYSLQLYGFFIDAFTSMANNMMSMLPFWGLIIGGLFVWGQAGNYVGNNQAESAISFIGRAMVTIGAIGSLWLSGLPSGLLTVLNTLTEPLPIAILLLFVIFFFAFRIMWRPSTGQAFNATINDAELLDGLLFISPNLLGFLIFFAGPLLFSLFVSFTDWDLFRAPNWIGFANYAELFNLTIAPLASGEQFAREVIDITLYSELFRFNLFGNHFVVGAEDKFFWITVWNTIRYTLMVVPLSVIPALFLATLLNQKLPGIGILRALYFLPTVAAVVGIALIWSYMYNSTVGWINYFIVSTAEFIAGLGVPIGTDVEVRWLTERRTALLAVVIMEAWRTIGFNTVLFLAGLQSIPKTLYEAATVDGANNWGKFRNVTLPMLAPTTFFVVTNAIITSFQVFAAVAALMGTDRIGGPQDSTLVMVAYIHRKGFQEFQLGYASAVAWVMVFIIFIITFLNFIRTRED